MELYLPRVLNLEKELKSKSIFLLGPRQTGKSSLIRHQLSNCRVYNLLLPEVYNRLNFKPQLLVDEILDNKKTIVIDEIQRIPQLLDVIHYLIEERKVKFLLTGSSARKLKTNHVNLLGGRARIRHLHPLIFNEFTGIDFSLQKFLDRGLMPSHYFSDDIESDLTSYIGTYLQQEIAGEGLTRNVPAFSRFLELAALGHGEQINFTNLANDAQVPRTTVHEYYQILKDTLIAHEVPAWREGVKRKPVAISKYYFFDWGVARKLQKLDGVRIGSPLFGKAFESFIFQEIKAYCDYNGIEDLHYWRTQTKDEVDFIIDNRIAVEVKAKSEIKMSDLKGLIHLKEEKKLKEYILVYNGAFERAMSDAPKGIRILPWQDFIHWLWSKK
jgi:predicted AAA+ superfamily ATPase